MSTHDEVPVETPIAEVIDLTFYEQQARALALVFGVDPDTPYPAALREELQRSGAFDARSWGLGDQTPAWRVMARELVFTRARDDSDAEDY